MKFLLKVAVLTAAAKFVLNNPHGTSPQLDRLNGITMRDISRHVDTVFSKVEEALRFILS